MRKGGAPLNRQDLIKRVNEVSSALLREKGYISFVDVLMRMDKLKKDDYEKWRFKKVPYLESVISVNLVKLNHMLRTLQENAKRGGLKASKTAYVSWGTGPKVVLRFSKTGDSNVEAAYSTHYVKVEKAHNNGLHTDPAQAPSR
jgi:hypothetical protein